MKKIQLIQYQCEHCEGIYLSEKEALECEIKEITQDKKVKIGDEILITSGDGSGLKGKVTDKWVINKNWGHYAWKRYWHTIAISVDIIGGYGSRFLTFDQYETSSGE